MQRDDFAPFVALLGDVMGLWPNAKPLTEGQVAMFFRALQRHPLSAVRAGLDAHVRDAQRGRFPPVPADVIAQIEGQAANDGRPGPEEAWAIALRSVDESATVVWTQEIAAALNAARPVLDVGDDVGARMAFREAYSRMVEEARAAGRRPVWEASEGWDSQRRAQAITEAVQLGRLPSSALAALPPPPGIPLLETDDGNPRAAEARALLRQLADELRNREDPESVDARSRRATEALKAAAAQRVEDYQRQRNALDAELGLARDGDEASA